MNKWPKFNQHRYRFPQITISLTLLSKTIPWMKNWESEEKESKLTLEELKSKERFSPIWRGIAEIWRWRCEIWSKTWKGRAKLRKWFIKGVVVRIWFFFRDCRENTRGNVLTLDMKRIYKYWPSEIRLNVSHGFGTNLLFLRKFMGKTLFEHVI